MPNRLRKWLRETVAPIALLTIVLCSFRSAVADWNIVPTGSMNPTIVEGDRIFVNKLAFGVRFPFTMWRIADWSAPQRGDVIVFISPFDGERLVKRVVALPGETVEMRNNALYIDGQAANYTLSLPGAAPAGKVLATEQVSGALPHPVLVTPALPSRRNFAPMIIPSDCYFVLGDNRDNSADSRYIGVIPRANLLGRSSRVLYSLDADDWYMPRFGRTLTPLP